MERLLTLLAHKNHYLENFFTLNESELKNFSNSKFENLNFFYTQRDEILNIIQYIDTEIQEAAAELIGEIPDDTRREISSQMAIKDEYVSRILAQDLEILACIENAKSLIIKELQEVKRAKSVVGKYRSPSFDKRLNEEV